MSHYREFLTLQLVNIYVDLQQVTNIRCNSKYVEIKPLRYILSNVAADLSLRCCLAQESCQDDPVQCRDGISLKGLAIATCCHHLCQWKQYISNHFFHTSLKYALFMVGSTPLSSIFMICANFLLLWPA